MVESPCVACCRLDADKVCIGCYRHITEIVDWNRRSDAENMQILMRTKQRKAQAKPDSAAAQCATPITQEEWQAAKIKARLS